MADTGSQASQEMKLRASAVCCIIEPLCVVLMRCPIYRDESLHLCFADLLLERKHFIPTCIHVAHGYFLWLLSHGLHRESWGVLACAAFHAHRSCLHGDLCNCKQSTVH